MFETILSSIHAGRDFAVALQRLLVSHPALGPENGGQGEKDKVEALKPFLAKLGFPEPLEIRAPDARVSCGYRPSLAYVIPGLDPSQTFWILSHLDVVPVGDRSLWQTDPFELVVKDDLIFGRGVEDNHQGVVSSILLAQTLIAQKTKPPINLGLLLVADEETNNTYGLEYIAAHHANLFKPNDLFLAPDHGVPSGLEIEIAEKSVLWLKVSVEGRQCHASVPSRGINSLRVAADFIMRLDALHKKFAAIDPLFEPPISTFEPTKKEANVENVNTIPGRDIFYIDCRVLPCYDLADVIAHIKTIGADVMQTYACTISYDIVQAVQAAPATSVESPIIQRLQQAIRAEYHGEAKLTGIGGGTLAAILRAKGYPAVVWASLLECAHQLNERASLSACLRDASVMARALFG